MIEPLVNFMNKKLKLYRGISSFISLILFIFTAGLFIAFIGGLIISEITNLSDSLPFIKEQLNNYAYIIINKSHSFFINIPPNIINYINKSLGTILNNFSSVVGIVASSTINFISIIPNILLFILVSLISAFFFSKDKDKIYNFLKRQLPSNLHKSKIVKVIKVIKEDLLFAIFGYIKAQFILMIFTFVESVIGLTILGIDYSILIALIVSVIDVLPFFGSGAVYIPWAIFSLLSENFKEAIFLIALYLIITLVRQTLEPKILSTQIGLYPLVTLMAIYIGLKVFGFMGIFLGPFIVIIFIAFQKAGLIPKFKDFNNN
ncbi:sporulation integral membrane protein YtvI [Caminicella sporogenes]|nr:sporulation integral membrane protein YtvI [Caminicella sporogenes]